jgi:hypothetical protein
MRQPYGEEPMYDSPNVVNGACACSCRHPEMCKRGRLDTLPRLNSRAGEPMAYRQSGSSYGRGTVACNQQPGVLHAGLL